MSQRIGWAVVIAIATVALVLMYLAPDSSGNAALGSLGSAGLLLSL